MSEHEGRIDYIELPANDLEAIKAFYGPVFGWSFTDWGPAYISFEDGRLNGGFTAHDSGASPATAGALVVLYTADLEAVAARVVHHGGTVVKPIFSFPGGRRFHFADPCGNVLAVWSDGKA